jgi:cobalt/nickel transport system permease protein
MAVVLIVQSLLFADGGITALGTNITLLGLVGVTVGWLVFRGLQAVLPKRLALVPGLAAVAAYLTVPVTALAFVGLYAVGGQAPLPLDTLTSAMVGWHALIGVGEAVITGLVVGSVVAVRPDLVYGARRVLATRELVITDADVRTPGRPAPAPAEEAAS